MDKIAILIGHGKLLPTRSPVRLWLRLWLFVS